MSDNTDTERKARPEKGQSRAPERERHYGPIAEFRNVLNVRGKDDEWAYRWFKDTSENGQRIFDAMAAGWDLVDATKETSISIGDDSVQQTERFGSVFRRHANKEGEYLYLMRMPKWAWEEVQKKKQESVDEKEADMFRAYDPDSDDGMYGQSRIAHELRRTRKASLLDD